MVSLFILFCYFSFFNLFILFIVSYKLVCSLILAGVVNLNTPLFTCGLSFGQVVREQSILMKLEV